MAHSMKFFISLLTLYFVSIHLHDIEPSEFVIEANATLLQDNLSSGNSVIVVFYAPWCGHCKKLLPVFSTSCEKITTDLSTDLSKFVCARVDCTKNEDLCRDHQVHGYPMVKILRSSFECVYGGPRDQDGIYTWARSMHYAKNSVSDVKKVEEAIGSSEVSVVGYFTEPNHLLKELAHEISCEIPTLNYITTPSPETAAKYGFDVENSLYVLKDKKVIQKITEAVNSSDLSLNLFFTLNDLVPEYRHDNTHTIFNKGISKYLCFVYDSTKQLDETSNVLKEFATKRFGEVRVFTTNGADSANKNVLDYFKVVSFPAVVFYQDQSQRFYHLPHNTVTTESLDKFVDGCIEGSIKHYVRKQPVPDDWNDGPVKKLVVDNFDEVFTMHKNGGAVLVFAPWCGHCQNFKPTWTKIAEDISPEYPDIFIGSLDHTENEIDDINVEGYPTIIVFKSRNEKVVYDGDRSFKAVRGFILKTLVPGYVDSTEDSSVDDHSEL